MKLFCPIGQIEKCLYLQAELKKKNNWQQFKGGKWKVISYYKIVSPRGREIKDFGMYFENQLFFGQHIYIKMNEALKAYGFILRN